MAGVIIEIITRGRGQPQYRRLRDFPYRIGRAYDNDLILHDDTVSAHHLQLEQTADGQLRVRNLSHENGSHYLRRKLGFVPEDLALPALLQLGHTSLRLNAPGSGVAPTRRHHEYPGPLQLVARLPTALILLLLVQMLGWWLVAGGSPAPLTKQELLLQQAPQVLGPLVMAMVTGFVSRLLLHRWQFSLQLSIACLTTLAFFCSSELQQRAAYYYSSDAAAQWISRAMVSVVYVLLLAWQLRAFSLLNRARALLTAGAIMWSFLLVTELENRVRAPTFHDQPDLQRSLRYSDVRAQPTLPLDEFMLLVREDLAATVAEPVAAP